MRFRKGGVAAASLLVFGLVVPCLLSASTIDSTTATFNLTTGGGSSPTGFANGTVSQFNPSLGTLTGITAFITVDINIDATVDLIGGGTGSTFGGEFSEIPTLANLPGVSSFNTPIEYDVNLSCATDMNGNCSNTASFDSGSLSSGPMPLSPASGTNKYTGLGSVPFQVSDVAFFTSFSGNLGVAEFNSTAVTGTFYLQYSYNVASAAVPEPGSATLLGIALLGLAVFRRTPRSRIPSPPETQIS